MDDRDPSLELETGVGNVRIRGYDPIVLFGLVAISLVVAGLYFGAVLMSTALDHLSHNVAVLSVQQAKQNCLLAFPVEDRGDQLRQNGYCDTNARQQLQEMGLFNK